MIVWLVKSVYFFSFHWEHKIEVLGSNLLELDILFFYTFYFEIIIHSQEVIKIVHRFLWGLHTVSLKNIILHNQKTHIGATLLTGQQALTIFHHFHMYLLYTFTCNAITIWHLSLRAINSSAEGHSYFSG